MFTYAKVEVDDTHWDIFVGNVKLGTITRIDDIHVNLYLGNFKVVTFTKIDPVHVNLYVDYLPPFTEQYLTIICAYYIAIESGWL